MKTVICLICTILLFTSVFAQEGKIYGFVTDKETNEPLVGVAILASKTIAVELTQQSGTVTDIDGKYELDLQPDNYVIEFKYIGYETIRRRVRIADGSNISIEVSMEVQVQDLGIVTVSASKYEKKFGEESVSIEVLTPEFIENSNSLTLSEALNKITGVNMIGETVNIRGGAGYTSTAGSRVLLLLDEVPLLSPHSGGINFGSLPLENVKQVEVIKGASSTLYGSSALNGTINFITENPKNEPYSKIKGFYGVYENPFNGDKKDFYWADKPQMFYGGSFVHRRKIKRYDLSLNGAYQDDQSYLFADKQKRMRFNIKNRYRPKNVDNLTVALNANVAYQTGNFFFLWADWDPSNVGDSLGYVPSEQSDLKEFQLNVDPNITYFDKKDNKHVIKGRWYHNLVRNTNGEETNSDLLFGEYTFHSSMKVAPKVELNFVPGVAASYSNIDSKVFSKRDAKNGAAFVQFDTKLFDKLTLTIGYRLELYKLDTTELTFKPIGRGGINYQLAEASYIRASFGQGYRYPSISEKYPLLIRAGQPVVPNPNLMPESSWSAEIGFKQGFKISEWVGYLDIAGFITHYNDMMEFTFAPNSIKNLYFPETLFAFYSTNVTDARISGFEISALGQGTIFGVKTNFMVGYTYLSPIDLNYDPDDPKYDGRSNMLNYRFKHSGKGDIEIAYKGFSSGVTGYLNSFMENVDPLVNLAPGLKNFREHHEEPSYFLDVRMSYDVIENGNIAFIVKNVTNNQYSLRPGFMEAPRNYTVQLAYEF